MTVNPLLLRFAAPALFLLLPACDGAPSIPPPDPPPTPPPAQQTNAEWLKANAHPIRSLSVADRDFSDLQPLEAAIGSARVVLLGEQSHGDGTTFLAKARLIAFLHQEMGFDVLAWESGLWDVRQVWRHVQAGQGVLPASRRGIFGIWTYSEQVLPTLDYVAETVGTARPLELAGFDSQLTGSLARDSLHLLMERFARRIGSPVADDPEWPLAAATLHHLAVTGDFDTKPLPLDQARTLRLLAALRADAAAKAGADRDALFWAQVLESIAAHAQSTWAMPPGKITPADNNPRDAQMARNLVWLANVYYPEKKIIAWAASSHIARDVAQLTAPSGSRPYAEGWTVHMGGEAHQALGTQMYAIGFTTETGVFGRIGNGAVAVPDVRPGSLEAAFRDAGLANAFVDLRALPAGGEWLRSVYSRPFGYGDLTGDWTRVFDGIVFTRYMTNSTLATR